MPKLRSVVLLCCAAVLLSSCYYLQSTGEPIGRNYFRVSESAPTPDLMVLLPGIGDYPKAFERYEFISELRRRGLHMDVVTVNAHIGYYSDRSLLSRLREDVVEDAFARGYERVHFAGISLGGFGSLLYLRDHPEHLSSVTLIAPYLGEPEHYSYLLEDLSEGRVSEGEENIWPWLESTPDSLRDKIYLGFGRSDEFADGHRLLRGMLPAAHSISIAGDHGWATWSQLWPDLLRSNEQLPNPAGDNVADR